MASENIDGPSNAYQVTIPCIIFFVLTPIFVVVRIWSRVARQSGVGWDDWTILVSYACVQTCQIMMMFSVKHGFGQHIFNLSVDNRLMALKLFYVAQIFYKLTINLTKSSILLLYLRIFLQRWFRICCYTLLAIILAYMVATTASSIFQCTPIRGAWDKSIGPKCISLTMNWYANAGFSIATDILILMLPMQPIWTSNLPVNQKRALMLVFALGGFVTFTSIMRSTTLKFSTQTPDITYDIASTLWTMIEQNVAIICACLPMCRMPLSWLFPAVFGGTAKSSPSKYSYGSGEHRQIDSQNQGSPWQPYNGPSKSGVNHSVVQHSDGASEEYILTSVPQRQQKEELDPGADLKNIRKTTDFHISYERD
ncbi:hypothetical protein NLU13_3744 [Sarocladium strictum]|uniref:Rhodopsin domain-containing protein n=1 Tax=Sarocladium strictum TaxID=5046 RepID=A0AA39GMM7_SARSR|nr:hypothetical protein NLU13_3744 [Sarocladium strictum]